MTPTSTNDKNTNTMSKKKKKPIPFKIGDLVRLDKSAMETLGDGGKVSPEQLNCVYRISMIDLKENSMLYGMVWAVSLFGKLDARADYLQKATKEEEQYNLIRKGVVCYSTKDEKEMPKVTVTQINWQEELGRYGYMESVDVRHEDGTIETLFPDELSLPVDVLDINNFFTVREIFSQTTKLANDCGDTKKEFFTNVRDDGDSVVLLGGNAYNPLRYSDGDIVVFGAEDKPREYIKEGNILMNHRDWLIGLGLYQDPDCL